MNKCFRVPGSASNLGPGFDALSLALEIYLRVEVAPDEGPGRLRVNPSGVDSEKMPDGEDNLIVRVIDSIARQRKQSIPSAILTVRNEIPLARGLGSSSAAIIAGITSYELLAEEQLSVDEIFGYALGFEPHPDNLAAGLFGGLVVSATAENGKTAFSRVSVPDGFAPVVVIPEFELSTEDARSVLPGEYSRADAVFNLQRSAMVVAALSAGNWNLLAEAMRDRIHQPYRAPLIPGLEEVLRMKEDGLFGVALSGAGPTILALAAPEKATSVGRSIVEVFAAHGVVADARVCPIDTVGRFSEDRSLTVEL